MSREWKPGDVAIVGDEEPTTRVMRVQRDGKGDVWCFTDGSKWTNAGPIRPLVVLDPEDREQVTEFVRAYTAADPRSTDWEHRTEANVESVVNAVQAALRSLIEPPAPVFAHYPSPILGTATYTRAMCGKVWEPGSDPKDCERCPECTDLVESMWIA